MFISEINISDEIVCAWGVVGLGWMLFSLRFLKKTLKVLNLFVIAVLKISWFEYVGGMPQHLICYSFTEEEDMSLLPQNRKAPLSLQMKAGA